MQRTVDPVASDAPLQAGLRETVIGPEAIVAGDLRFSGRLTVGGRVSGHVKAFDGAADALLVLSAGAIIEGDVDVTRAMVAGCVGGSLRAADLAELSSSARVLGSLRCGALDMQLGAFVAGPMDVAVP